MTDEETAALETVARMIAVRETAARAANALALQYKAEVDQYRQALGVAQRERDEARAERDALARLLAECGWWLPKREERRD